MTDAAPFETKESHLGFFSLTIHIHIISFPSQESQQLENDNKTLQNEIMALEREKEKLKRILQFHDDRNVKCPKKAKLSESDELHDGDEEVIVIDMHVLGEDDLDISEDSIQIIMGGRGSH